VEVEDEVAALYLVPLDRFTVERDALAKRLTKEKRRDEAAAVKVLKKPSAASWALNQLSTHQPHAVQRVFDRADQVKAAQNQALGGDRKDLRQATKAHEEALRAAAEQAVEILEESGNAASPATQARLVSTLRAAAVDAGARAALQAARLSADLESTGWDSLDLSSFAPVESSDRGASPAAPVAVEADRHVADDDELAIRRRRADHERRLDEARRTADERQSAAESLRDRAERLADRARRAEEEAAEAHANAAAAAGVAEEAARLAEEAAQAVRDLARDGDGS
jgi:hypothetical protein